MEIDFSPLGDSLNAILFALIKVLGMPFVSALLLGLILSVIKVPRKIIIPIITIVYLYGAYRMVMVIEI